MPEQLVPHSIIRQFATDVWSLPYNLPKFLIATTL